MEKEQFQSALAKAKDISNKRNFKQSVDLIINLTGLDPKKPEHQLDLFVTMPHSRGKKIKVCGLVGAELGEQAKEIFEHMRKESTVLDGDPGLRGRTSIAPLSKMDLVVSKKTVSKLYITNFGKKFLKDDFDIGEIFLEYFLKWTLPNPDNTNFSEKDGFNIRPFIATLHIINEVNKKWTN